MKQKGFCIFCHTGDDYERVFEVETNDEYSYCPQCGRKIKTEDAVKAFKSRIQFLLKKAYYEFNIKTKYDKAYEKFGDILLYDEDNPVALCGRIESLLMMSTLRQPRFEDASVLINYASKSQLHKSKNMIVYFDFLLKYERIARLYIENIKKMLTNKNFFYDEECVRMYVYRTNQIKQFYSLILQEILFLLGKGLNLTNAELKREMIELNAKKIDDILKSSFTCVDGITYRIKYIHENGISLVDDGIKIDTKLNGYKIYSLVSNEQKKPIIKDRVFKLNRLKYGLFIFSILSMSMAVICATAFFVLAFCIPVYRTIFFVVFGVSILILIACLCARFILKALMKKKKLH